MSTLVKICGIRTMEVAKVAVDAGASFLGFNFVPSSKRYIDPKKALEIINSMKGKTKIVGVFQNADSLQVNKIISELGLDFVQLHGHENNQYINQMKVSVIKSITLDTNPSILDAKYLILDRERQGEGRLVDTDKARLIAAKYQIFLAGGLNPDNVSQAVNKVNPFAVDVAGGVETNGIQDIKKIKDFIQNTRRVKI